jgi:hypothetical protein
LVAALAVAAGILIALAFIFRWESETASLCAHRKARKGGSWLWVRFFASR